MISLFSFSQFTYPQYEVFYKEIREIYVTIIKFDFRCSPCIEMLSTLHQGHFPSLDQLKKHLCEAHGHSEEDLDSAEKLESLVKNGLIVLPSDLRSLNCRFCEGRKILLGQDRMAMSIHIRHRHNMKIPRHVFKYQCRMCHEEFKSSENLLSEEHQCQKLLTEFYEGPSSSSGHALGHEGGGHEHAGAEDNATPDTELCNYCPTKYPVENKASHRGKHLDLDFLCAKCTRSFPFLDDIKKHLSNDHELVVDADDGVDAKHLADNGWLVMPKDLRVIQCPECHQPFLCQDRQTVLSHLKKKHGVQQMETLDKRLLSYSCRACPKDDFSNSAEVFQHGCNKNVKYERNSIGGEYALRSSETLLPLEDIVWNSDTQVPGDLRRMACRLCGFQVNGHRFFKMVHHLEEKHDKYQQCRAYKLDFFVKFGCGHCTEFNCDSVHTWDKHFLDDHCTKCVGQCCEQAVAEEQKQNNSTESRTLANDIRLLICKLCSATFPKKGFEEIQTHLKSQHTQEICDAPMLANFVDFGCIKCPTFSPKSLADWKEHFHMRNTTCNNSHAAAVAAANITLEPNNQLTCKHLSCKICQFAASDYYVMCKHLEVSHNVDTKPSNANALEMIGFGCHRCPNFKPEDKLRWERHFSSDNYYCQGSGEVQVLLSGKARVLYWCDACQETRENIQGHFTGPSHQAAIEALPPTSIIACELCSIGFTSQGNLGLHLQGDYHKQRQATLANNVIEDVLNQNDNAVVQNNEANAESIQHDASCI